jgi:hypothetical protein
VCGELLGPSMRHMRGGVKVSGGGVASMTWVSSCFCLLRCCVGVSIIFLRAVYRDPWVRKNVEMATAPPKVCIMSALISGPSST